MAKYIEFDVDGFAVAIADEAIQLRLSGIRKPILVLGGVDHETVKSLKDYNFIQTITSIDDMNLIESIKRYNYNPYHVAIKINSGMNRIGFSPSEFDNAYERVINSDKLKLESIYTHFFAADNNELMKKQLDCFNETLKNQNTDKIIKHCCASNCLIMDKSYHMDMVRCGIALYGYSDSLLELKPAMTVYTSIVQINKVKCGEYIGYGTNFLADNDMVTATIRVGYADGYRRNILPRYVSIKGVLCKVVGKVCMDMTMVDVTNVPKISILDKAYLLNNQISGEKLAESYDTIVYEVLTDFGNRAVRTYNEG